MFPLKLQVRHALLGAIAGLLVFVQLQHPQILPLSKTSSRDSTILNISPAILEIQREISCFDHVHIGQPKFFSPKGSNGHTMLTGKPWGLPAGAYTPRQIVEANAPLLETVIHHLGPSAFGRPPAREQLIHNLASNLALNTREASITIPANDASRVEIAVQAVKIGKRLIEYVRNVTDVQYDPEYVVCSPCEGHLLKPDVFDLMFGSRSLRHLMQIYNEYLHQMVLLRDALLPFDNFEDVIIPITAEPNRKRGMHHIEEIRQSFLAEVMTKQVTQRSTIKTAQFLLAPTSSSRNSIGFQYEYGTVLPAFIASGNSGRLLRYVPTLLNSSSKEIVFNNELLDYYTATRASISKQADDAANESEEGPQASLASKGSGDSTVLALAVDYPDGTRTKVDLGQAARGYRYAKFVSGKKGTTSDATKRDVQVHSARSLLLNSGEGLVMLTNGTHLVRAVGAVELYALLGKLYPENVVVMEEGQSLGQALEAGKEGLPDAGSFVIEVRK
ncbi:hypothetical protein EJ02DRAFT_367033 [Clathrospora elynae]|uniref:Uncharacterized protein n=1 Tax=Clathrospora elynae TaxID=706981 RepID=A0A6A5T1F9_9PLEO|nr:hypothetical protein EJ02DRAFT_367033 [Clathrospora elynae]